MWFHMDMDTWAVYIICILSGLGGMYHILSSGMCSGGVDGVFRPKQPDPSLTPDRGPMLTCHPRAVVLMPTRISQGVSAQRWGMCTWNVGMFPTM